jgi:Methyltransferase domain
MMRFAEFVLEQLPPPPGRVLEVGCGEEGGVALELDAAGYDVLAIDPDAPEGPLFRRVTLEGLDDPGPFDAVVAGRVLHHVSPLGPALDKLARLAPLLLIDEFAPELIQGEAQRWYEGQYRALDAAGVPPKAPPDLDEWRRRTTGLHPSHVLLAELEARFETRVLERRPYFYRWLRTDASRQLEETLVATGALPAIGWRYAGVASTETVRSSAASR